MEDNNIIEILIKQSKDNNDALESIKSDINNLVGNSTDLPLLSCLKNRLSTVKDEYLNLNRIYAVLLKDPFLGDVEISKIRSIVDRNGEIVSSVDDMLKYIILILGKLGN